MRTLRDLRHMGSVLWVTFQLPDSHFTGGGVSAGAPFAGVEEEVEGWRSVRGVWEARGGVPCTVAMVRVTTERMRSRLGWTVSERARA